MAKKATIKAPINLLYTIRVGDKYVKEIEANENYAFSAHAPTMGNCHTNSEFTIILDDMPTLIEKLTVANYLRVLFEEFTWQEKPLNKIIIEPIIRKTNYGFVCETNIKGEKSKGANDGNL